MSMTLLCENCGGMHYGHNKCPFTNSACVVCGDLTIMACSDCAIDTGQSVHICTKIACRDQHELTHHTQISD